MCKEDVRLARAAVPAATVQSINFIGITKVLPANAERYSLLAGFQHNSVSGTIDACVVAAKFGDNYYPLLGVSSDHPVDRCNIMDVGQIITYEIWAWVFDENEVPQLMVSETEWNVKQDKI